MLENKRIQFYFVPSYWSVKASKQIQGFIRALLLHVSGITEYHGVPSLLYFKPGG